METHAPPQPRFGSLPRRVVAAFAVLLLVAALPATALSQGAEPEQVLERVEQTYGPAVGESVEGLARTLREQGVPAAPVWDRALEGAAREVPEEAFRAGLRSYGKRLAGAAEALPPSAGAGTVVAAAGAIQRGVAPEAVREVVAHAAGRGQGAGAPPVVVLGDLASAGVPVDRAVSVVRAALQRGLGPRQMLVAAGSVRDLIDRGRGAAAAARVVERALGRSRIPTSVPGAASLADLPVSGGAPIPPAAGPPGTTLPHGGSGG